MKQEGVSPWKMENVRIVPTLSYHSIRKPLRAPAGKKWNFDPLHKKWNLAQIPSTTTMVHDPYTLKHYIVPSDTFQGICLKYKITPLDLRRANGGFSGENLSLVPNPLTIPRGIPAIQAQPITHDEVVQLLLDESLNMSSSEARAYLLMHDWDFIAALENAREDGY